MAHISGDIRHVLLHYDYDDLCRYRSDFCGDAFAGIGSAALVCGAAVLPLCFYGGESGLVGGRGQRLAVKRAAAAVFSGPIMLTFWSDDGWRVFRHQLFAVRLF